MSNTKNSLVLIWGDSFAWATANLLDEFIAEYQDVSTVVLANYGRSYAIPPLLNFDTIAGRMDFAKEANEVNSNITKEIGRIVKSKKIVSVILQARWTGYTKTLGKIDDQNDSLNQFKLKLFETIKRLTEIGINKLIIFLPFPEYKYNISQCVQLHPSKLCFIDRQKFLKENNALNLVIQTTAAQFPNTRVIDPLTLLCSREKCFSMVTDETGNEIPAVWDDSHPSMSATKLLGRKIKQDLLWLVSKP